MRAILIDPEQKTVALADLPSAEGLAQTGLHLANGDALLLRKAPRAEEPADLSRIQQRYGVVQGRHIFTLQGRHFRGTGVVLQAREGAGYGDCRCTAEEVGKLVSFEGENPPKIPQPARVKTGQPKPRPSLPGDFKFREEK